ncbi:poly(A) polymerase Pap1 [Bacillus ectoiniformans]|uniref:hypothetical protein n=1 Tax=Bacillus ectoiniformans TaxID=1494429 RepID=UPI0019569082|nr:hypothetical protein [Bacillus ectoiniformans]MBM7648185.1 poly(A) polymerase Pap1 [Bacillus ectoiniformans]
MKKGLFMLTVGLFALLLSGCFSDPIQEDIINYSNEEMTTALELETAATSAYESVSGANYTDDETMYLAMVNEVIPNYNELVKELDRVEIETDELREVHESFIEGADIQYNAFVKIVNGLEAQDPALIEEANGMLEKARKHLRDYRNGLDKLAKEHDVEWEE